MDNYTSSTMDLSTFKIHMPVYILALSTGCSDSHSMFMTRNISTVLHCYLQKVLLQLQTMHA